MQIYQVTDERFKKYGKVISNVDFTELVKALEEKTPLPEGVEYVPGCEALEALPVMQELSTKTYGEMPIQIGYCNGHNCMLNAFEYHRSSEINVAVTDLVLLIGSQQDITDKLTYDTSKIEAFLVPAGTGIEVYATTLHYAPCHVEDGGFRCVVILPKDTNTDMEPVTVIDPEDRLLFAKNKWLIGHTEGGLPENAWIGLKGENITI